MFVLVSYDCRGLTSNAADPDFGDSEGRRLDTAGRILSAREYVVG